jgi:AraC-like DNA-binding protein
MMQPADVLVSPTGVATAAVRPDWAFALVAASQRLIGEATLSDPSALPRLASTHLLDFAPPTTPAEMLFARSLLFEVSARLGESLHQVCHRGLDGRCGFEPGRVAEACWRDRGQAPARAVLAWAERYAAAFEDEHPLRPLARQAADWIGTHLAAARNVTTIARELGARPAQLRRAVRREFGVSVRVYVERRRVEAALDLLGRTPMKVEAVAREVGYRSKKSLYRAIRVARGTTPGLIRGPGGAVSGAAPRLRPKVDVS